MTDSPSPFARPVREFLTWARIEAGLAPATLEAYGRDLGELSAFLVRAGVDDPTRVWEYRRAIVTKPSTERPQTSEFVSQAAFDDFPKIVGIGWAPMPTTPVRRT